MWQFPVFVKSKDSGDVNSYNSVKEMLRALEQIDVENDEYQAWDATGLPAETVGTKVQRMASP